MSRPPLDPGGSESILENIRRYHEETGATVILVTHSMEDVARIADRLVVIEKGGVAMSGTPAEVFSRPEELKAMGLAVPKPALIAMRLRQMGLPIEKPVYTTKQAADAILALMRGGRCLMTLL
jgi:energy-coupling factor transport system ATP-binding protein